MPLYLSLFSFSTMSSFVYLYSLYVHMFKLYLSVFVRLLSAFNVNCMHQGSESYAISILCMYVLYMWKKLTIKQTWLTVFFFFILKPFLMLSLQRSHWTVKRRVLESVFTFCWPVGWASLSSSSQHRWLAEILPRWPAHNQRSECAFGRSFWISVSLENVIEAWRALCY